MKCLGLICIFIILFVTAVIAFAATPTVEPQLPWDIGKWEKYPKETCKKYAGKVFVTREYGKKGDIVHGAIKTITLNGKKIFQHEMSYTPRHAEENPPVVVTYVKNTPWGSWLKFEEDEEIEAAARFVLETGLTSKQLLSCNW